jgi:hypothetical protein
MATNIALGGTLIEAGALYAYDTGNPALSAMLNSKSGITGFHTKDKVADSIRADIISGNGNSSDLPKIKEEQV